MPGYRATAGTAKPFQTDPEIRLAMHVARPGTLYLVVGPSGAGKDALMGHAAAALADTHAFPRRYVTRPAEAGGEDHVPVTREDFAALRRAGGLALHWEAHGLGYGIGIEIEALLARGLHVVCNVSRGVVEDARRRYASFVVSVEAPAEIRAERLRSRGREDEGDIAGRLMREVDVRPDARVVNDGTLQAAQRAFLAVLSEVPRR